MLRIKYALPHIFQKAYPILDPNTPMLLAISLLRFHEIDALPLSFGAGTKQQRAVFGFSTLAGLVWLEPKELGPFLKQPCEAASEPLATVSASRGLATLLNTFARTRFGFARVEDRRNVGALASLSDVLSLYETGAIETGLVVEDVGSPILAVPGDTSIKEALDLMFERRYRRLFVSGGKKFVSDREITGHIFSPAVLKKIMRDGKDVLEAPISTLEEMNAKEVPPGTALKEAAGMLKADRAGQCLVLDGMVATPWDIVMKPWKVGALKLKATEKFRSA